MIELRNISKSFGGQELFDEGAFTVGAGEKIGLVGRNGYGKTTLFRIISGELEPDSGVLVIPRHYRIGCLKQTLEFSRDTVLGETCLGLPESEQDDSWKAEKVLHGLGFSRQDMQRPPQEFSGGFQVRINLAKILISQANMLLLDEPNNYLDVVAIRWLVRFLREWRGELMLITHERSFMDQVVTHVVGIHRKKLRKMAGRTGQFYQQIAAEEEVYENTRQKDARKRRHTEEFISKFRAKARQAGLAQSRLKTLAKMEKHEKLEAIKTVHIAFNPSRFGAGTMLNVTNISFGFDPAKPKLFEDISFRIGRRERLCVAGKNGKGKSTLLRVLAGELSSSTGTIKPHPSLMTGYYAQPHTAKLGSGRSVLEEIMTADPEGSPQRARTICGSLLFTQDLALKPVSALSGGEKSRVLLGKIMMRPCHLLLLDEPTNHLDMESSEALCQAIDEFPGSVIMVTHDELMLERVAERMLVFDGGGVRYFEGGYRDFLDRFGWQDEPDNLKAADGTGLKDALSDKQLRRLRAQQRQERQAALEPLEKKITQLESSISDLETELQRVNEELVLASHNSDAAAIAELGRMIKELPRRIEEKYGLLEDVFKRHEEMEKKFI